MNKKNNFKSVLELIDALKIFFLTKQKFILTPKSAIIIIKIGRVIAIANS